MGEAGGTSPGPGTPSPTGQRPPARQAGPAVSPQGSRHQLSDPLAAWPPPSGTWGVDGGWDLGLWLRAPRPGGPSGPGPRCPHWEMGAWELWRQLPRDQVPAGDRTTPGARPAQVASCPPSLPPHRALTCTKGCPVSLRPPQSLGAVPSGRFPPGALTFGHTVSRHCLLSLAP